MEVNKDDRSLTEENSGGCPPISSPIEVWTDLHRVTWQTLVKIFVHRGFQEEGVIRGRVLHTLHAFIDTLRIDVGVGIHEGVHFLEDRHGTFLKMK